MASVFTKKLLFVTGKGGVGKSTVCAAIAKAGAARGKRVLVCEIDTDSALARMFDAPDVGFDPIEVEPGIWAANIERQKALTMFVRRQVPGGRVAELILKNKVAQSLFESAPSVMETVMLDQIATLALDANPAYDLIVVDLPASGHAVNLMNVPARMAELIGVGELSKHIRGLAALIANPEHSELLLVTLPEEMPVNETLELHQTLKASVRTPVRTIVVNGVRGDGVGDADVALVDHLIQHCQNPTHVPPLRRIQGALRLGRFWHDQDLAGLTRVREAFDGRIVELPYLFRKTTGTRLVAALAAGLGESL